MNKELQEKIDAEKENNFKIIKEKVNQIVNLGSVSDNTNYHRYFIFKGFHYIVKPLYGSEQHIIWCKHISSNVPIIVLKHFIFDDKIKYNSKASWKRLEVTFGELSRSLAANSYKWENDSLDITYMNTIYAWIIEMTDNKGIQKFENKIRHSGRHKPGKLFNDIKLLIDKEK